MLLLILYCLPFQGSKIRMVTAQWIKEERENDNMTTTPSGGKKHSKETLPPRARQKAQSTKDTNKKSCNNQNFFRSGTALKTDMPVEHPECYKMMSTKAKSIGTPKDAPERHTARTAAQRQAWSWKDKHTKELS